MKNDRRRGNKLQFKQLQLNPKTFSGLQRDSNPSGLCVNSAAVLYQLSYKDP